VNVRRKIRRDRARKYAAAHHRRFLVATLARMGQPPAWVTPEEFLEYGWADAWLKVAVPPAPE
jgi:hypothetical protein